MIRVLSRASKTSRAFETFYNPLKSSLDNKPLGSTGPLRSLAMGNDGGSIPTRRELVKNAARDPNTTELKATQQEAQTHAWTYCPLSSHPLVAPIVSDCAGTLYNKDAVLEQLLPQDDAVPATLAKDKETVLNGRVKGLRDVVEIKFAVLKQGKEEKKICPITSKELGPSTKAVYLVPCGHAFAEAAIRELAGETCTECNEPYEADNVIPILPLAQDEIARLAARASKLRAAGLTHSLKKAPGGKKRKKHAEPEAHPAEAGAETPKNRSGQSTPVPQARNGTVVSSGIKNAATASLTSKVLEEQEERNKRRKLELNDNLKALFSKSGHSVQERKGGDFMTRGYSIPKRA